ncbi:MAG: PKD domain-containing protein [Candidatus Thermoplasmatota archaeon]
MLLALAALQTFGNASAWYDDFESGASGWSHYWISGASVPDNWVLVTNRSHSTTTSWWSGMEVANWVNGGDTALESPPIDLSGAPWSELTFWHWYYFDGTNGSFYPDGGLVEIDAGAGWTQIFPDGGYDNMLSLGFQNPLEGRWAFTIQSPGWVQERFNLTAYVGGSVRFRFHVGWDYGTLGEKEGWFIDDVFVANAALYDHDVVVLDLQAASRLQPGQSTFVNATIRNDGRFDESSVVVNLTVDSLPVDGTTIPSLLAGAFVPVTFPWTPPGAGNYTVCVAAQPVPSENITTNNAACAGVRVSSNRGFLLFDQTHATDSLSSYSVLVNQLVADGYIVDSLLTTPIDAAALAPYDVFIVPQAHTLYSAGELSAIQAFVGTGGGLLVIGDDNPSIYTDLSGFADITWMGGGVSGTTFDITPHDITLGVTSVYLDAPIAAMTPGPMATSLVRDLAGGHMLVISETPGRVAGFADEGSLWDFAIGQADNLLLANQIIEWLMGTRYEHDVAASGLQAPRYLEPGTPTVIGATIRNIGLNNETGLVVDFKVDGVTVDTTSIASLVPGVFVPVSFPWTPLSARDYTVCVEVQPVPSENDTTNNAACKVVQVRITAGFILFDQGHFTEPIASFGLWVTALTATGFIVDTLTGSVSSAALSGYDVFVVAGPQMPYSAAELAAIQQFVVAGGGLLAMGDDPWITMYMTAMAGIFWESNWFVGSTTAITPHEVTMGVSSVELRNCGARLVLGAGPVDLVRDTSGWTRLAVSETPGRLGAFGGIAPFADWGAISFANNLRLARNLIAWLAGSAADLVPPVISSVAATPDPQEIHGVVNVTVQATDDRAITGAWFAVSDPSASLVGNFSLAFDASSGLYFIERAYGALGVHTFSVSVRDGGTNWAVFSGSFLIQDTTRPVARAGPDRLADEDATVTFDGTASTDNNRVQAYLWTFDDGGLQALVGPQPSYTFATPGTFLVTLTVMDASGNAGTDTVTVIVRDLTPPSADAGPDQEIDPGDVVTFSAAGSSDNVDVTNYTWTLFDGEAMVTLYGPSPSHAFSEPGSFAVTLVVRDAWGNADTDVMLVTVIGEAGPGGQPREEGPVWPLVAALLAALVAIAVLAALLVRERRRRPPESPESSGPTHAEEHVPKEEPRE